MVDGGQASLQRTIGPLQFLIFGFGSIVGTAWVVLLGVWLKQGGPGGAMAGIAAGGAAMALIAAMYAELGSRLPRTGGEVTYITEAFGKTVGFVVGWLLTLIYLSALIFEGVALAWLLDMLFPPIARPVLYIAFGQPVGLVGLLFSLTCCTIIAVLNYRGARDFVRFQNILTALFVLIVLVTAAVELFFGSSRNLLPVWSGGDGGSWLVGAAWVMGSAPMIFNSFQSVLHAIEERSASTSPEMVVRLCVVAVACVTLFYLGVVFAAARATPWHALASSDLPAIAALAGLPWSGTLRTMLLLALMASLLKAWNSVFMCTLRLLLAQARDGMIPASFGSVNPKTGAPDKAVFVVAFIDIVGLFPGKGLLEPIVNTISLCVALIFALTCAAVLVLRKRHPDHAGFRAPGGTAAVLVAIAASLGMASFALFQPAQSSEATLLKWALLLSWAVLGLGLYGLRNRRAASISP